MRLGLLVAVLAVSTVDCSKPSPRPQVDATSHAAARPNPAPAVHRRLDRGEALPPLARQALVQPMRRHGDNMEALLWAALMLDHESTAEIASWIEEEPRIARPPGDVDVLNAAFPAGFFQLQDDLRASAGALSRAAAAGDDDAMAELYGRVARTCVKCHSLYLRLPPVEEE